MDVYTGKSASKGIAIGQVWELVKRNYKVTKRHINEPAAEIARFNEAVKEAKSQLQKLKEQAVSEVGNANAAIFEVHQVLLEDEAFTGYITKIMNTQHVNAEFAIESAKEHYAEMFAKMEDAYLKERYVDIKDVADRLLNVLTGNLEMPVTENIPDPAVIVADDLTPSETLHLLKHRVLAFVIREGSLNSHTAILARTLNIPAIVTARIPKHCNGQIVIVDGDQAKIIVKPDERTIAYYQKLKQDSDKKYELLSSLKGKLTQTADGKRVRLNANISGEEDVFAALFHDAEGIGLFRTEFIYLKSNHFPTEEEQFQIYKNVVVQMNGKKVIVRTFDIGADKQVDYLHLMQEENPALGLRGLRVYFKYPNLFRTQLRALYRAAYYGPIGIMIPMVTSVWELESIKQMMESVKEELNTEGVLYKEVAFGIMIETPAAVMISEELATYVDFFSIGTNDLSQYTLAVDRQNGQLENHYDAHHKAILKMIQMVVENAHAAGIWVGICGELAQDLSMISKLISMGVDELSVVPSMILPIRDAIRQLSEKETL